MSMMAGNEGNLQCCADVEARSIMSHSLVLSGLPLAGGTGTCLFAGLVFFPHSFACVQTGQGRKGHSEELCYQVLV